MRGGDGRNPDLPCIFLSVFLLLEFSGPMTLLIHFKAPVAFGRCAFSSSADKHCAKRRKEGKRILLRKDGNTDLKHVFFDVYPKCHHGANEKIMFNLWAECP